MPQAEKEYQFFIANQQIETWRSGMERPREVGGYRLEMHQTGLPPQQAGSVANGQPAQQGGLQQTG